MPASAHRPGGWPRSYSLQGPAQLQWPALSLRAQPWLVGVGPRPTRQQQRGASGHTESDTHPTSCESWESDDARGTSHPWEPWQAGYAGDADVTLDSLDVAGSPGQPRDACESRDPWHSLDTCGKTGEFGVGKGAQQLPLQPWCSAEAGGLGIEVPLSTVCVDPGVQGDGLGSQWQREGLTFQAQVPFESHGSFVSFLPFDIFHSWQDDGRGSWGAGVPSAAWEGTEQSHCPGHFILSGPALSYGGCVHHAPEAGAGQGPMAPGDSQLGDHTHSYTVAWGTWCQDGRSGLARPNARIRSPGNPQPRVRS